MPAFLYRCPSTGYNVQGYVADTAAERERAAESDTYQSLTCTVCGRTHLVNPRTGKVAGHDPQPRL